MNRHPRTAAVQNEPPEEAHEISVRSLDRHVLGKCSQCVNRAGTDDHRLAGCRRRTATLPAPADKGHRDSVPSCPSRYILSYFFHDPCELVARDMGHPDIRIVSIHPCQSLRQIPQALTRTTTASQQGLDQGRLNAQRLTKRFVNSPLS